MCHVKLQSISQFRVGKKLICNRSHTPLQCDVLCNKTRFRQIISMD
uniref:TIDP9202 n=1 Tax=Arundo donax TaxID=35708 RepID=A0A0A9FD70_ARUDO